MVQDRVLLGRAVAVALLRDDVQQLRAWLRLQLLQGRDQRAQVVAVDGAGVVEAELLEQGGGRQAELRGLAGGQRRAHGAQSLPAGFIGAGIGAF
ncbi:hypothetical protein D9M68_746380 [compost metagenome]